MSLLPIPARTDSHRLAGFGRIDPPISGICEAAAHGRAHRELLAAGNRNGPLRRHDQFDVAYSVYYQVGAAAPAFARPAFGKRLQERFFDYHEDLAPHGCGRHSGGKSRSVYEPEQRVDRNLLSIEKVEDAGPISVYGCRISAQSEQLPMSGEHAQFFATLGIYTTSYCLIALPCFPLNN